MPHVAVLLPVSGAPVRTSGADALLHVAGLAEEHGFDAVFLAVVAGHTERIGVEVSVLQLALHQSAVVAKQLATLAYLAPGRLAVGIGVGGEHPAEWAACGVPRLNRAARRPPPRPESSPPSSPVSQLASPTESRTASTRYRRSQCRFSSAAAGRPARASFWHGMQLPVFLSGSRYSSRRAPAEAHRPAGSDGYCLEGTAESVLSQLRAFWDAGCERFKLSPIDTARGADQIQALDRDVLPEMRTWR